MITHSTSKIALHATGEFLVDEAPFLTAEHSLESIITIPDIRGAQ